MPEGTFLSFELKRLMKHHFVVKNFDARTVWDLLFENDSTRVSLGYLEKLQKFYLDHDEEEINSYVYSSGKKSGRKRLMEDAACEELLELQRKDNTKTTVSNHTKMVDYFYPAESNIYKPPSVRTAQRTVKRLKVSRKVLTVKNSALDQAALNEYFEKVSVSSPAYYELKVLSINLFHDVYLFHVVKRLGT